MIEQIPHKEFDGFRTVYTSIVGSHMHGLATPQSDLDARYINIVPLRKRLSPYRNYKVSHGGGDEDTEAWEFSHFCKLLAGGNGTTYEVLWSPYFIADDIGMLLRENRRLFLNSHGITEAHMGYANQQLKRYLGRPEREPDCFKEPNWLKRIPKATVAAYRIIWQGIQLVRTGDFTPKVADSNPELAKTLIQIKTMDPSAVTPEFCRVHSEQIESYIQDFKRISEEVGRGRYVPDYEAIEDLIQECYTMLPR